MASEVFVLVPLAGIGMVAFLGYQKMKHRNRGGVEADRLEAVVREMAVDMEKLHDRVAVLEKLATDGDRKLASEIERLRDPTRPSV